MGIAGWLFHVAAFDTIVPGLASMKANTAIAVLLLGVSLFALREPDSETKLWLRYLASGAVTALCLATLVEYLFDANLGIDELFFRDLDTPRGLGPGRMAPFTAISLGLLGIAALAGATGERLRSWFSQTIAMFAGVIGFVALVGYLYSATSLYQLSYYSSVALSTSISITVAALGLLSSRPETGVTRVILSAGHGGVVARRLLPVGIFMPIILGWIRLAGQHAGYFGLEVGLGLMVIAMTTVLVLTFLLTARTVDSSERDQRRAQAEARESLKRLRAEMVFRDLLESAPEPMVVMDHKGEIVLLNLMAEKKFGYNRGSVTGQTISELIPRFSPDWLSKRASAEESDSPKWLTEPDLTGRRQDGREFPIEITLVPVEGAEGLLVAAGIRDVTDRVTSERKIHQSEEQSRLLVEGAKDYAIFMLDPNGIVMSWNEGGERMKGYRAEEILGEHFSCFYPFEALLEGKPARELRTAISEGQCTDEGWRLRKDHSRFWASVVITPIYDEKGQLQGFSKFTRDITERKKMEDALFLERERAQVTLNSIGEAVVCTDVEGNVNFLNIVAETITGWTSQEANGKQISDVVPILDAVNREPVQNQMLRARSQENPLPLPPHCILVRRDGLETPIEFSVSPIHDRNGKVMGSVMVFHNVSAAWTMALRMAHSAEHDFLTGLPNRMLLSDRIGQAIAAAPRTGKNFALLFLDLNDFKQVNDSHGHQAGDLLLQSVAHRLVRCVRNSDTVCRQGGDEFVVLLLDLESREDAENKANEILLAVAEVHTLGERQLNITTSIGISFYPEDGEDAETLIRNADTAMYEAKKQMRGGYQFFKPEMNVRTVQRKSLEDDLQPALESNELSLHYQPKINLETGKIVGAEALLRWAHRVRGQVPPADFIPVAEDSGMMLAIGEWVLCEACKQARAWQHAGLPIDTIAVNISALQFRQPNFLSRLFEILNETGLPPSCLVLEMTETVLMKQPDSTESVLSSLRARGVRIAVDDFGTGHSSLNNLRKFPVSAIKIDQSFIRQINSAPDEAEIVTAVISMGRSLRLKVIAVGVETKEQMDFLLANRCDEAQGYLFSEPLPAPQFAQLLESGFSDMMAPLFAASSRPTQAPRITLM